MPDVGLSFSSAGDHLGPLSSGLLQSRSLGTNAQGPSQLQSWKSPGHTGTLSLMSLQQGLGADQQLLLGWVFSNLHHGLLSFLLRAGREDQGGGGAMAAVAL